MIENMPKKINYTLTEQELAIIKPAIKTHEDLRVRQRAQIIRLLHKEQKPEVVAEILDISVGQVYWWHRRWREEGLVGLGDKARSGRPTAGDEAYQKKLEELLQKEPQALGYGFTVWDSKRLMKQMEAETEVKVSERTFRNILARMDYVYRRPKHDLSSFARQKKAKERAAGNNRPA